MSQPRHFAIPEEAANNVLIQVSDIPEIYFHRIISRFGAGPDVVEKSTSLMSFVRDLRERGIKHIPSFCLEGEFSKLERALSTLA